MSLWKVEDRYKNPGPIQYYHEDHEVTQIAETVRLQNEKADNIIKEISGLCASI